MKVEEGLLNVKEEIELVGVSRSTLHRMVRANQFPGPIRIGLRASRWRKSEIPEWLESRAPDTEVKWR